MLNLFRMEVYKIFREKSIYITAAAILGVIFIALATMKVITSPDLLHSAMESGMDITAEDLQDAQAFQNSTQVDFLGSLLFSGGLMVCLMAIVSAIFVCDDFTTGFGKIFFLLSQKKLVYYKQINDLSHCQRVFPDCFYPAYLPVFSPYGV